MARLIFFFFCIFFFDSAFAAKLDFTISFPVKINTEKLLVFLDDGVTETMLSLSFSNNTAFLKNDIKGKYATVTIVYPVHDGILLGVRMLVNPSMPSYIKFKVVKDSSQNQLANFSAQNAFDANTCKQAEKIRKFAKAESDSNKFYSAKYNELPGSD
ncbi:MAG: hypothetical protein WKF35_01045 [Ferruginibacter sp.]